MVWGLYKYGSTLFTVTYISKKLSDIHNVNLVSTIRSQVVIYWQFTLPGRCKQLPEQDKAHILPETTRECIKIKGTKLRREWMEVQ